MYNKARYTADLEFRQRILDGTKAWQKKVQQTEDYKAKRREISKRYYQNNPEYRERQNMGVRTRRALLKQESSPCVWGKYVWVFVFSFFLERVG